MLEDLRGRATDLGFAMGWRGVRSAPPAISNRAFRAAADAAARRNGRGARQLRANLRRVVGSSVSTVHLDALVRDALRSYARYWLETFRLPAMNHGEVLARIDAATTGREFLDAALERGRGVVLALPHIGNWDVAGLWLCARYGRFTTVAERLKPESLYDRFVAYREGLGFEVVPLTGATRSPVDVLRERLRQNRVVCLLGDRDLSAGGLEVDFFGEPARMPPGPALLAATTGAALLPVGMWFTEDGWAQDIEAPIVLPEGPLRAGVRQATQTLAAAFERRISAHPADWHMLQRLWVADLAPGTGAAAAVAAR
jgi:lauroyl/myristoyl acyltransferase